MLASILKLKRGLLVAALAGGLALAIAGPATAAPKLVLSDTVHWKGIWSPASAGYRSTFCTLKSDEELSPFPCGVTGVLIPGTVLTGEWSSADGTTSFELAPAVIVPTKTGFTVTGTTGVCVETDAPDPSGVVSPPYKCVATVKVAVNTAKSTISGTFIAKELSTEL